MLRQLGCWLGSSHSFKAVSYTHLIIAVVLAGSACFSYPDTVETEFTLTTQNPPAYIMAQSAGRIEQLYTANSQPVGKGDVYKRQLLYSFFNLYENYLKPFWMK